MNWFRQPQDEEWMATRKIVLTWITIAVFLASLVPLANASKVVYHQGGTGATTAAFANAGANVFVGVATLTYLAVMKRAPCWLVEVCSISGAFLIVLADYASSLLYGTRKLNWIIIIVDVCLLCQVHRDMAIFVSMAIIFCWQVIVAYDTVTGFGLYEVDGAEFPVGLCTCANPPCKKPAGYFFSEAVVFSIYLLDYIIKRKFARQVKEEKKKLSDGIELSRQVVDSLVRFNLKEARDLLGTEQENELNEVLSSLISNLEMYRPYLPDTLFLSGLEFDGEYNGTGDECMPFIVPPGYNTGHAAIVFTDIKSSTSLWETYAEMPLALQLHNSLIRKLMQQSNGYEVKTIGDSFMIAFENLVWACEFGLLLQEELPNQKWPTCLGIFELQVRISSHYGEVSVERNTLTSRYDYFGTTVNKASRMEGVGIAGTVTITADQLELIPDTCTALPMGTTALRGLKDKVFLYALVPNSNIDRINSIRTAIDKWTHRGDSGRLARERSSIHDCSPRSSIGSTVCSASLAVHVKLTQRKNVTVAHCHIVAEDAPFCDIKSSFSSLLSNLGRTSGTVLSLHCTTLVVTWNTVRDCPAHLESAFRFCELVVSKKMCGSTQSGDQQGIAIGLSCGGVVSGEVGNSTQKFITVVGSCVQLSGLLCDTASELGVAILHSPVEPDGYCAALEPTLVDKIRPVDKWKIIGRAPSVFITVYQVSAEDIKTEWEWSKNYSSAFYTENTTLIVEKSQNSTCSVFRHVADLLVAKSSLRKPILIKHHYQQVYAGPFRYQDVARSAIQCVDDNALSSIRSENKSM